MITVDAMGQQCPIPVVMTKEAINKMNGNGIVQVLVDNEIAVQNLEKMAKQKGYDSKAEKKADGEFTVMLTVGAVEAGAMTAAATANEQPVLCQPNAIDKSYIAVIGTDSMGTGDEKLGKTLLKGFIFALSKQDILPSSIIFYNRGAFLTTKGSESIEDLKTMEAQGVEILTCGTCMDYYGLTENLQVGSATNMYVIVEKQTTAQRIVRP